MLPHHLRLSSLLGAILIGTTTTASPVAQGDDEGWSRFRGPNGSGVASATELPVDFGPEENVVWRTPLPPGHSSPVLMGERLFLTAVEGEELFTYCLDRASGTVAWRRQAPRARVTKIDSRNNAASPSPAVDVDTVVVFFEDFGLLAYDLEGEERWRVPLGPFDNLYGMGASPVLLGDAVVLPCDQNTGSYLLAVSKKDGETLWRTPRPEAKSGHATPVLWQPEDGDPELILAGSFFLDSYDPKSGEKLWWVGGLSFEIKSVPVLVGDVVLINGYGSPMNDPGNRVVIPSFDEVIAEHDADEDGQVSPDEMPPSQASAWFSFVDLDADGFLDREEWDYLDAALASRNGMLAIRAGGEGDRTEGGTVWSYHRSVPQLPSPLVYHDVLYMLNDQGGLLTTFRPLTGEVLERGRLAEAIDNYYASPVAADDKVYIVSENGLVSVLPAGGSLEPLATNDLGERCYATPALADGRIYLRTTEHLFCFGSSAGDDDGAHAADGD